MNQALIESLESRTLLSAGIVQAGVAATVPIATTGGAIVAAVRPAISSATLSAYLANDLSFASSQLKQTMSDLGTTRRSTSTPPTIPPGFGTPCRPATGPADSCRGRCGRCTRRPATATGATRQRCGPAGLAGQATAQTEDLYFRLMTTYLPLYRADRQRAARQVLLNAAASKETEWNSTVGAFENMWGTSNSGNPAANFPVLMDQTTDMLLMLWASQQTGNQTYYNQALEQARKVIQYLIRPDGSIYQFGYFNSATGAFVDGENYQGYSNSSTWARGQAWAIYSLTGIAAETGQSDILAGAEKVANCFIDNLPSDYVPYWDFDDPSIPNTYRDSSAAAIAASGLIQLSTLGGREPIRPAISRPPRTSWRRYPQSPIWRRAARVMGFCCTRAERAAHAGQRRRVAQLRRLLFPGGHQPLRGIESWRQCIRRPDRRSGHPKYPGQQGSNHVERRNRGGQLRRLARRHQRPVVGDAAGRRSLVHQLHRPDRCAGRGLLLLGDGQQFVAGIRAAGRSGGGLGAAGGAGHGHRQPKHRPRPG